MEHGAHLFSLDSLFESMPRLRCSRAWAEVPPSQSHAGRTEMVSHHLWECDIVTAAAIGTTKTIKNLLRFMAEEDAGKKPTRKTGCWP